MPGLVREQLAGCIKWLPRKAELANTEDLEEGCCNHPVVVISTRPRNGRVKVLIVTSLGGRDLEARFMRQSVRLDHLPIAPANAHPDNGILLVLADASVKLRKKSYVKTRNRHSVLLASLLPYNNHGPEVYLSKRSYATLVKYIRFTESPDLPPSYVLPSRRGSELARAGGLRSPDVAVVMNYGTRGFENLRADSAPRSFAVAKPAVAAARSARLSLLPAQEYRPLIRGSQPTLPTTHPIRTDGSASGSPNWHRFWNFMSILLWICLCLGITYGLYRGGSWLFEVLKGLFAPAGLVRTSDLWASFL